MWTSESMEWAAYDGWGLAGHCTATQKIKRMKQAMVRFSLGARNSPPSEKLTRPLDIFLEWNLPGETS